MTYKYFIGCIGFDDVKIKFKTLAKTLHPDRGGKHEEFVTMKSEYDFIVENPGMHSFPIVNAPKQSIPNFETGENYAEAFRRWAEKENAKTQGDFAKARQKANQQRAGNFEENFDDFFGGFAGKFKQQQRSYKETEEQRQTNRFVRLEVEDFLYAGVKDIFEASVRLNKTAHWMLFEIFKIENLGLDNFKHLAWLMKKGSNGTVKCDANWQADTYQKYLECWRIKWPMDI